MSKMTLRKRGDNAKQDTRDQVRLIMKRKDDEENAVTGRAPLSRIDFLTYTKCFLPMLHSPHPARPSVSAPFVPLCRFMFHTHTHTHAHAFVTSLADIMMCVGWGGQSSYAENSDFISVLFNDDTSAAQIM
jgi:hypothetical protein